MMSLFYLVVLVVVARQWLCWDFAVIQPKSAIQHAETLRCGDMAMVRSYQWTNYVADVMVPQPLGFPALAFGFLA